MLFFQLLHILRFFCRALQYDLVELEGIIPVRLVQQRQMMLADRDPAAVGHQRHQGIEQRALRLFALDRIHLVQEAGIPGQLDIAVDCLGQPELIIRAVAGLFAAESKVVVCISHAEDIFDPAGNQFLDQRGIAFIAEIVHRCVDILNFPEADFTIGLLRPGKASGDIGLIQRLERKVVSDIGVEHRIFGSGNDVGRILLPECDDFRKHLCKGVGIAVNRKECGDLAVIIRFIFIERLRHAGIGVDDSRSAVFQREGFFHGEERRHLPARLVGKMSYEIGMIQGSVSDEIRLTRAESIHGFAFRKQEGKALFDDVDLRLGAQGEHCRLSVVIQHFAFRHEVGIDDIAGHRTGIRKSEDTGQNDAEISLLSGMVFDLNALRFHCGGHAFLLRENEDRAHNLQSVFCFIGDHRTVLGMNADCGLHVFVNIRGIENLLSVFREIELTVGRFAVFRYFKHASRRQHLVESGCPEGSSSQSVQSGFGGCDQRIGISCPIAEKQVDRIVGTDRHGHKIQRQFSVFVEFSLCVIEFAVDFQCFLQHFLRCGYFSFGILCRYRTVFDPEQKISCSFFHECTDRLNACEIPAYRHGIRHTGKPDDSFPRRVIKHRVGSARYSVPEYLLQTLFRCNGLCTSLLSGKCHND